MSQTLGVADRNARTLSLKHNGLSMECFLGDDGKLERKIERLHGLSTDFSYRFDQTGHLLAVMRNGVTQEE